MAGAGGRRGGSDLGKAAIDWEAAFTVYASLPPEQRSYQAIATRYGVSTRTVETHGRRERWRARARRIDQGASAEAERRIGKARADQIADVQKLIEASFIAYAQQLGDGTLRLTAADLPRLVKLLHELWAEPQTEDEPTASTTTAPPPAPSLEHMAAVIAALQETNIFGPADRDHDDEEGGE
jgi:hypothetical protein